jgi:hypothetical protein
MKIRVIFNNNTAGIVRANILGQLIENGQVAAYFDEQWISVRKIENRSVSYATGTANKELLN